MATDEDKDKGAVDVAALLALAPEATHVDLYFLPANDLPVLGWSEPALEGLLSGASALGRPVLERFVEHSAGDVTLASPAPSAAAEEPARARRVTVLRETTLPLPPLSMCARALKVTPLAASEFPSQRRYDATRHVTRAKWTLHHRVRLLAECDSFHNGTTLYLRYNHAPNVDPAAVRAALRKGARAVMHSIAPAASGDAATAAASPGTAA